MSALILLSGQQVCGWKRLGAVVQEALKEPPPGGQEEAFRRSPTQTAGEPLRLGVHLECH